MKFKPLSDRVLVEPVEVEAKTASGIIIPDAAKEKPLKGKVVAVGPGDPNSAIGISKDSSLTVKIGDEVLFGQYTGKEVEVEGSKYLLMIEKDIYGIL